MMSKSKSDWYKRGWGLMLAILFLPLFLLWYVWVETSWSNGAKWMTSELIVVICFIFLALGFLREPVKSPSVSAVMSAEEIAKADEDRKAEEAKRQGEQRKRAEAEKEARQAAEQKRIEDLVAEISPTYCKNHTNTTILKVDQMTELGIPTHADILKHGFTDQQCRTIIEKMQSISSDKEEILAVAERKYWIGMDYRLLTLSIGTPHRINNTTNGFGTTSQWVYEWSDSSTDFFYIENGKLTSYQNM